MTTTRTRITLFNSKKKKLAAEAVQAQRAQASALQAQLDEVRSERARLETRLSELGETNAQLDRRLEALDQGVRSMGEQLVTLSSSNSDTNRRVRAIDERVADNDVRFDALNHRLDQVESYGSELDDINQRLRAFSTEPSPVPPPPSPAPPPPSPSTVAPPPPPVIEPTEPGPPPPPPPSTPGVDGDVDEHIAELRERLDDLARQTSSVDDRVTSVSMELANQLTELSSDIDELNRRSESVGADAAAGVDAGELDAKIAERLDAALDDVLDSTERLATEQARYEIQFRSDLAELAERLRRPGTT